MGWSFSHEDVSNVKALLDENIKPVKSAMVGRTYYAAVKVGKKVRGLVVLTSVRKNEYENFGMKLVGEDMGPFKCECPEKVLNELTPTDDKLASLWRERCHNYNESRETLNNLPVGSIVVYEDERGEWRYTKVSDKGHKQWARGYKYIPVSELAKMEFEVES